MQIIREKVAWAIAGVLALFVVVSMTGVVSGGPLDPPGPPAPSGPLQIAEAPLDREFTSVVRDCSGGGSYAVQGAISSALADVNTLGADKWNLVGEPVIAMSVDHNQYGQLVAPCTVTYTLSRPVGVGIGCAPTPPPAATTTPVSTATGTTTPASTNTPQLPTSTPCVPSGQTATPTSTPTPI